MSTPPERPHSAVFGLLYPVVALNFDLVTPKSDAFISIGGEAQSTLEGNRQDIFAPKICMKN